MVETQFAVTDISEHLNDMLHVLETGDSVELTRNGKPVAVLVSVQVYQNFKPKQKDFWDALEEFRQGMDVSSLEIADDVFDVRDSSPGREVAL